MNAIQKAIEDLKKANKGRNFCVVSEGNCPLPCIGYMGEPEEKLYTPTGYRFGKHVLIDPEGRTFEMLRVSPMVLTR